MPKMKSSGRSGIADFQVSWSGSPGAGVVSGCCGGRDVSVVGADGVEAPGVTFDDWAQADRIMVERVSAMMVVFIGLVFILVIVLCKIL